MREGMKGRPVFVRPTRAASRTRRSSFGLVLLALPAALFASSANSRACVPLAAARRCHAFRHPRTLDAEGRGGLILALIPAPKSSLIMASDLVRRGSLREASRGGRGCGVPRAGWAHPALGRCRGSARDHYESLPGAG